MNLKTQIISGLSWSMGVQIFRQLSQFITVTILAQLLSPDDFGLLGMATVATGLAMIFAEMGMSSALIQKQKIQESHRSTAFWMNILGAIALSILFYYLAPFVARFYQQPELVSIIRMIGLCFISGSIGTVPRALLQKEMLFQKLSLVDAAGVAVGGIFSIIMAWNGAGVWSLVLQLSITISFPSLLLFLICPWRPRPIFSVEALLELFQFSIHMIGFNLVNYLSRNIDYLLIGKFLGPQSLGYYTLAYKLMLYPLQNISHVIGQVMFPAFAKIQQNLPLLRKHYLKMVQSISFITFPMMAGLFIIAPETILVFYGPQWASTIPILRIFCLCGLVQSVGTSVGQIYLSQGRADLQFRLQLLGTTIVSASVMFGLRWGSYGVALMYTLQSVVWVHWNFWITTKLIHLPFRRFYLSLVPAYLMSLIMSIFVLWGKYTLALHGLSQLIVLICLGIFSYAGLWMYFRKFLRQHYNKDTRRAAMESAPT